MKRLAIVEYTMSAGGVERVLRGLAGALLQIPEAREWDITLLLTRYNSAHHRCEWPQELTGPNLRVEWLGERSWTSRFLDRLAGGQGLPGVPLTKAVGLVAAGVLRNHGPDWWRVLAGERAALIAQAADRFDLLYFTFPVMMEAPRVRVPIVVTPQDFNFKYFLAENSPTRQLQEKSTRTWLERSDRLLFSSQAVRDELRTWYPEYAGKAEVVPLGISVGGPSPSNVEIEEVRRVHHLPAEFALMPGWVLPHKNQLVLVEAIRRLRERGSRVPVVFVGPNAAALAGEPRSGVRRRGLVHPYVEDVRLALRDAGLVAGRDFYALGFVTDAEIRSLYRLATVLVVPSLYEGFGLPGLEAMQAGCPTLLAAIPPLLEQNGRLGGIVRTFDPKDAGALAEQLVAVLANPEQARAAADLAAERVNRCYDWKNTARGYLAAFGRVLESRHTRPVESHHG